MQVSYCSIVHQMLCLFVIQKREKQFTAEQLEVQKNVENAFHKFQVRFLGINCNFCLLLNYLVTFYKF